MTIESLHDADKWGPLRAGPTPADKLASVADLVRYLIRRDGCALSQAAALVADTFNRAAPQPELFETRQNDSAAAIAGADWWRKPVEGRSARQEVKRGGWSATEWGGVAERVVSRPAVTDRPGIKGAAAVLQALADACKPAGVKRALLDAPPWVRLALRASVAARLFGYGAEPDAAPVLPASLPAHDAGKWGHNVTAEGKPRDLVRLADAVRAAGAPGAVTRAGMAPKRAAAWLLDGLSELDGIDWFELDIMGAPLRVTDADAFEWRPAYPSGPEHDARINQEWTYSPDRLMVFPPGPYLYEAEARARGVYDDQAYEGTTLTRDEIRALSALPSLRGPAGAVEWLRLEWVERLKTAEDLDTGRAGFLAVPAHDLARLAWLPAAGAPGVEPASSPPVASLYEVPRSVARNTGQIQSSSGLPADDVLLAELVALEAKGQAKTTGALAAKYGVNRSTIQRAIERARLARGNEARPQGGAWCPTALPSKPAQTMPRRASKAR